jgi:predicted acyltransferase
VVGNALAIVMPGLQRGTPPAFWAKVARRTAVIFALGLLLNAAPFVRWDAAGHLVPRDWEQLRIMGVLQRIALCWSAAAVIVWWLGPRDTQAGARGVPAAIASLLLGYWALCLGWGDAADPYGLMGWFGTEVDRAVLGAAHLYRGEGIAFDPEGLASTPPAIAQVLIGWWVGRSLQSGRNGAGGGPDADTLVRLFVAALGMVAAAYLWQLAMPINKKIWTSSYVLLTSGLATATLAALAQWLDRGDMQAVSRHAAVRFCEVFGQNALFVFVMSGLVPRLLLLIRWDDGMDPAGLPRFITPLPWLYRTVFADLAPDPRVGSLLFAIANLAAYWALAAWLDRRQIHIRV